MWLNQWRIWSNFVDNIIDSEMKLDDGKTAAVTKHRADYREASLSIRHSSWDKMTKTGKNQLVAHEMTHVLLAPLREFCFKLLEELPDDSTKVYWDWFHAVDELLTTHVADVLLDAAQEISLKKVQPN